MRLMLSVLLLVFIPLNVAGQTLQGDPLDRFGRLRSADFKARVDSLLRSTKSNGPRYYALVELRFEHGSSLKYRRSKVKTILWTIDFLKYPQDRVALYVRPDGDDEEITLWVVPNDADLSLTDMTLDKVIFVDKLPKNIADIFTTTR